MAAGLALAILLSGCGRKADPLPPIIEVPETTTDLEIRQEVDEAVLTWSYPVLTRAGNPLNDLQRVEIWRLEAPPGQEVAANEDLKRQLMLGRGKVIARLEGESLAAATRGSTLVYRNPLPHTPPGTAPPTLLYAVRSRRADGTTSALSNITGGEPQPVPPEVTALEGVTSEDGIALSWHGEGGQTYLVERREAAAPGWERLGEGPLDRPSYLDRAAVQGSTWLYRVRIVVGPIWGPPTTTLEVPYPDVYPPLPVEALICLPEPGRVVLRWEPPSERGVRYTLLRRPSGDESWTVIADRVDDLQVTDDTPPDELLEYVVTTVDAAGNQSEPVSCTVRPGG